MISVNLSRPFKVWAGTLLLAAASPFGVVISAILAWKTSFPVAPARWWVERQQFTAHTTAFPAEIVSDNVRSFAAREAVWWTDDLRVVGVQGRQREADGFHQAEE